MSREYKIETIWDVLSSIPTDKVALCMKELGEGLAIGCVMVDQLLDSAGIEKTPENRIKYLKPCKQTWIDDGKGEISCNVTSEDHSMNIKVKGAKK